MTKFTSPNNWSEYWCLFVCVCVVGPGFDLMHPAFVRSRASQAAWSDGKKNGIGPHLWGRDCVDTIVQISSAVQPRAGCVFLDRARYVVVVNPHLHACLEVPFHTLK